jgi:hypothetical protein
MMKKVGECARAVLQRALQDEKGSKWVTTRLCPILTKNLGSRDERTGTWTIRQLGKIASLGKEPAKRKTIIKEFLKIWFSDDIEPDSSSGEETKLQLVSLASNELFQIIKTKAKDPDTKIKEKAEILFKELTQFLTPR